MRRLCIGILLFLALATPNYAFNSDVDIAINTATEFLDDAGEIADTFEKAEKFAKKLKRLDGALGLLGTLAGLFGQDEAEARHQQIMNEFAKVHQGITEVQNQISFLKSYIKYEHKRTRLFDSFEVIRQAIRLFSFGQQKQMLKYCKNGDKCYHALEQLARHAPDLLDDYIKSIPPYEDYVRLVAAYAHRLISVIGNGLIIVEVSMHNTNENYLDLDTTIRKIENSLEQSKWRLKQIEDNIKLDAREIMRKGRHHSTHDVLKTIRNKLWPKYYWLSLGILVYNDIYGFDKHSITGNRVDVFHESGKNVVVFYKSLDFDSFKGGKIGHICHDTVMAHCAYVPCGNRALAEGYKKMNIFDSATIDKYNGLWYQIPNDFNYCVFNRGHVTGILIKHSSRPITKKMRKDFWNYMESH